MARSAARSRRRRTRHPAGTREALLVAATRLFAERGLEGVPVAGIAEAAGVNKALVSYHFGGKRELYFAIIVSVLSEIAARAETLAASSEPAPDPDFDTARHLLASSPRVSARHGESRPGQTGRKS
jgi:AcrR family transcriptional regulator